MTPKMHTFALGLLIFAVLAAMSQDAPKEAPKTAPPAPLPGSNYSGMYAFLREGEFVQVTVEEEGRVTGFISRFGDSGSDSGEILDQFFKSGKLDGKGLTFTTNVVHG